MGSHRAAPLRVTTDGMLADLRRALDARYGRERAAPWFAAVGRALANPRPAFVRETARIPIDPEPHARVGILVELLNRAEQTLPCAPRFRWNATVSVRRSEITVSRRLLRERRRPALLARTRTALMSAYPDRGEALAELLEDRLDRAGWFPGERDPLRRTHRPAEALPPLVIDVANLLEPSRNAVLWQLETHSRHTELYWTLIAHWPSTGRR